MTEAKHGTKLDDGRIECELCPQRCRIPDTGHGICLGRVNRGGTLYADNYGQCVTVSMDPVEKKPLFHFLPGSSILSIATVGCNLHCKNCQNW
ncbi:AmmeMemoRadiSam system radical SAM enzyme, partial [bacterium]|nr:AmmeMemoRadiSam system radical SAM enzyme [bacterium]